MRSIVHVHLAFAAVASGLGSFDHTRQRQKHEVNHKAVQEHSRFIRSENGDIEQSGLEVRPTGKMRLKKSISATHKKTSEIHLAPESANMAEIHHAAGDATQTTTLSAIHLMASTTAKGLVPPPERKFGTTTIAMGSTSQQPVNPLDGFPTKDLPASLASQEGSERQPTETVNTNDTTNTSNATVPPVVPGDQQATEPISMGAEQVTNAEAAFEVTGCSAPLDHFNGIYMPSSQVNTNQGSCTSLVWSMSNDRGIHVLYHVSGAWCLDLTGNDPAFNGIDDGQCAPETQHASWSIVDPDVNGGGAPTINRKAAQAYTTTTTVVWQNAVGDSAPYYYHVTDAGIPGFNGVYWMTPIVIADVRCQRMFSKGGPDNTEYTLAFGNSNGAEIWYFQSLIGGQTLRPYIGTDDGSCSPEVVTWQTVDPGNGVEMMGGTPPNVARSLTYSTTTTTTTTIETTTTTTTMVAAQNAATGALRIGVAGNLSNAENVTNTTPTEKTGAHRNFSMLALRLLFALAVAHALS